MVRATVAMAILLTGAAPPGADPNSDIARWYHSLQRPDGHGSCCGEADCRPAEYRISGDRYEVKRGETWWPVDPKIVTPQENPTGHAVLCVLGTVFICFIPASGV